MWKSGIDQEALVNQFASASAKQAEQLRHSVGEATLAALQGRELTLKNIRGVVKAVTQAASQGVQQNALADAETLLDRAVAGMDDALLRAVDANRVALQRFVDQGLGAQEKQLKKALDDLEHFEDALIESVKKSAADAGGQVAAQWAPVIDKLQAGGTASGHHATAAAQEFAAQMYAMHSAMRQSRAASVKAVQTLAQSYAAMVSGVLIGMTDALRPGAAESADAGKKTTARAGKTTR